MRLDVIQETRDMYDELAEDYRAENKGVDIPEQKRVFIERLTGLSVLDLGCGPGRDCFTFSNSGLNVTGIDLSRSFLEMAAERAPDVKYYEMDMRALSFSDESYDGVWSCSSMLHVPKVDAQEVVSECYRVLKVGGVLFLSLKEGVGEIWVEKDEYRGHRKFFALYGADEILAILNAVGFKIEEWELDEKVNGNWINIFARK